MRKNPGYSVSFDTRKRVLVIYPKDIQVMLGLGPIELRPGEEDISLTEKIKYGGRLLDIQVLDHIIITKDGYYSFAGNEML